MLEGVLGRVDGGLAERRGAAEGAGADEGAAKHAPGQIGTQERCHDDGDGSLDGVYKVVICLWVWG